MRGGSRDNRETFVVDSLRLRDKGQVPPAPNKGAIEFYCRQGSMFWLDDTGVEHRFGGVGVSASPGFTWGRTGAVGVGTYLLNDQVPSNITGRLVTFGSPMIRKILVTTGAVGTFTLTVEEHDGVSYTTLTTVSLSSERTKAVTVDVPVTSGKQLAVKVSAGTANNPVVGIILDGVY